MSHESPGSPAPFHLQVQDLADDPRQTPFGLDIAHGQVPSNLPDCIQPRRWIHVADRQVLVRFPRDKRVLVEDGQRVTLHLPVTAGEHQDHTWVGDNWGIPIAMMQRGFAFLHASAVRIGDSLVAIAGRSGAGKSTTAFALQGRGHELIMDEATLLQVDSNSVTMHPYQRRLHLTESAARHFSISAEQTGQVTHTTGKVAVEIQARSLAPAPLTHVVVLEKVDTPHVETEPLSGAPAIATLSVHAERLGIAPLIMGRGRYLAALTAVAQRTSVFTLRRPAHDWSLDAVLDAIEELALLT